MKVFKRIKVKVNNFQVEVGDQIAIKLAGLGDFTATVQTVTEEGALFMFDDYVAVRPMNEKNTNEGGYENSDLRKWIERDLFAAFPEKLRNQIENLTIPTYGQMFGHDEWYDDVMDPDADEQFQLMKKRRNRIADFNDEYEWGWLQNATKQSISAAHFAYVGTYGHAGSHSASYSYGVRPCFSLRF